MEKGVEFRINLPKRLFEDFYRLFPGRGERQTVIRRLIVAVIKSKKAQLDYYSKVIIEAFGKEVDI